MTLDPDLAHPARRGRPLRGSRRSQELFRARIREVVRNDVVRAGVGLDCLVKLRDPRAGTPGENAALRGNLAA
jgi:hypothetical protein